MATLEARLTAFSQRIRDQFNTIRPRLTPLGGGVNAILTKTSAADNAVAWTAPRHRFGFFCAGKQAANDELLGLYVAEIDFTLPNGLVNSIANAGAAATVVTIFLLKKNGTTVGTVTFAAGATTGTFATSTAADVAVLRSDRMTLVGPSTADATLADIGFTFAGTR